MNQLMARKSQNPRTLLALIVLVALFSSCTWAPRVPVRQIEAQPQDIALPPGDYYSAVWADDNTLAFLGSLGSITNPVLIYDIGTGNTYEANLAKRVPATKVICFASSGYRLGESRLRKSVLT